MAFYKITGNIFALSNLSNLGSLFKRTGDHMSQFPIGLFFIFVSIFAVFEFALIFFNVKYGERFNKINAKIETKKRRTKGIFVLASTFVIYSSSLGITTYIDKIVKNSTLKNVAYACNFNTARYGLPSYYLLEVIDKIFFNKPFSLEEFNNYFKSAKLVKDDLTETCKDFNVISILFESGQSYLLNPYTMPNTYNLLHDDGLLLNKCYCVNSTFPSEMLEMLGNNPSYLIDTGRKYTLPYSLPNIIKNQSNNKYVTSYYCDFSEGDPFKELQYIPYLGFDNVYSTNHLMKHKQEECNTDSRALAQITEDISGLTDKFFIHYTSYFTHMDYDDKAHGNLYKYLNSIHGADLDRFESEGKWENKCKYVSSSVANEFRNFTLASMDFDKGIGTLINYLKSSGKFNNTLVVLYGDHEAKGVVSNRYTMTENVNKTQGDYFNIKNFGTICGFSNPHLIEKYKTCFTDIGKDALNKFSSPMNIASTVLDLLGLKYNPRFCQGKSIFQDDYDDNEVFFSQARQCFINEHYYSKSGVDIDRAFLDNNTKDIFINRCKEMQKQMTYFDYIYGVDFFKDNNYEDYLPKE